MQELMAQRGMVSCNSFVCMRSHCLHFTCSWTSLLTSNYDQGSQNNPEQQKAQEEARRFLISFSLFCS